MQFGMDSRVSSELPQSTLALFPKQFEVAATHLKPVVVEHPAEPHKQAVASLAMSPFLLMQSGADIHIQGWLVEQGGVVEDDFAL